MHKAFLGRPDLPRLSLDLVEVEGGGCVPSQFWGRTADGSHVYIRYRGAWLSIHKSRTDDAGMRDDRDLVYQARIGPTLHGMITLEQVSDLTGLTVRGQRLSLSEAEFRQRSLRDDVVDFSGRRLFVDLQTWVTDEDLADFITAVQVEIGDVALFAPELADLRLRYRPLEPPPADMATPVVLGFGRAEERGAQVAAAGHMSRIDLEDMFELVLTVRRYSIRYCERYPKRPVGTYQEVEIKPGMRRVIGLAGGSSGGVRGQFEVKRPGSLELAQTVLSIADRFFIDKQKTVDLLTGEVVSTEPATFPRGRSLVDWCRQADDRYLSWTNRDRTNAVGYRPT